MFIDIRRLERDHGKFIAAHRHALADSADDAAKAGENLSKNRPGFKHRSGNAKARTKGRVLRRGGKVIIRMSNDAKYAAILEKGSRPHIIRPKKPGGVLRFNVGGQWVSARQVRHPGTKPYRFLSKGRDVASRMFEQVMRPRMIRAARSF
jgi:hypothetical protein